MLLVIFGAGASFDSLAGRPPVHEDRDRRLRSDEDYRPPLAVELFRQVDHFRKTLRDHEQAATAAMKVLEGVRQGRGSLEEELERVVKEGDEWPLPKRWLMSLRYYLQEVIWSCSDYWGSLDGGMTNYLRLVSELEVWRYRRSEKIAYVTFNYDRLLEEALRKAGVTGFRTVEEYVSEERGVFKVHGSVDWGQVAESEAVLNAGPGEPRFVEFAAEAEVRRDFVKVEQRGQHAFEGKLLIPAIAMPVVTKTEFAFPQSHEEQLREWLASVDHVLVIGWRGREEHFLKLMRESHMGQAAETHIVSGTAVGAAETQSQIVSADVRGRFGATVGGFTEFMTGHAFGEFLGRLNRL